MSHFFPSGVYRCSKYGWPYQICEVNRHDYEGNYRHNKISYRDIRDASTELMLDKQTHTTSKRRVGFDGALPTATIQCRASYLTFGAASITEAKTRAISIIRINKITQSPKSYRYYYAITFINKLTFNQCQMSYLTFGAASNTLRCLFFRCVVLVDKSGGQQRCLPSFYYLLHQIANSTYLTHFASCL
jgi:hypothetical protein